MMILITKRAVREFDGYTVWKPHQWNTAFFAKTFGNTRCRRAKLFTMLPFGFGLFWTFGTEWFE